MWFRLGFLAVAALLEIGGDALIRRGLLSGRGMFLGAGALILVAYGFAVNTDRAIDFGRLMGIYIAVFFVISQFVATVVFGERLTPLLLLAGSLIAGGGIILQLWG